MREKLTSLFFSAPKRFFGAMFLKDLGDVLNIRNGITTRQVFETK
jgi:hypothetical protein